MHAQLEDAKRQAAALEQRAHAAESKNSDEVCAGVLAVIINKYFLMNCKIQSVVVLLGVLFATIT